MGLVGHQDVIYLYSDWLVGSFRQKYMLLTTFHGIKQRNDLIRILPTHPKYNIEFQTFIFGPLFHTSFCITSKPLAKPIAIYNEQNLILKSNTNCFTIVWYQEAATAPLVPPETKRNRICAVVSSTLEALC